MLGWIQRGSRSTRRMPTLVAGPPNVLALQARLRSSAGEAGARRGPELVIEGRIAVGVGNFWVRLGEQASARQQVTELEGPKDSHQMDSAKWVQPEACGVRVTPLRSLSCSRIGA
jgi:hypothetical protein